MLLKLHLLEETNTLYQKCFKHRELELLMIYFFYELKFAHNRSNIFMQIIYSEPKIKKLRGHCQSIPRIYSNILVRAI